MKRVLLFACVFASIILLLFMIKNTLARHMIMSFLKDADVSVDIGQVELNILQSSCLLRDVYINNPTGFSDNRALDIELIKVHYSPLQLVGGEFVFDEVFVRMRRLRLEHNPEGRVNILCFSACEGDNVHKNGWAGKNGNFDEEREITVKRLCFQVDKVTYAEIKGENDDTYIRECELGLCFTLEDVNSMDSLMEKVVKLVSLKDITKSFKKCVKFVDLVRSLR
jgi:hypothetical protein